MQTNQTDHSLQLKPGTACAREVLLHVRVYVRDEPHQDDLQRLPLDVVLCEGVFDGLHGRALEQRHVLELSQLFLGHTAPATQWVILGADQHHLVLLVRCHLHSFLYAISCVELKHSLRSHASTSEQPRKLGKATACCPCDGPHRWAGSHSSKHPQVVSGAINWPEHLRCTIPEGIQMRGRTRMQAPCNMHDRVM